MITCSTCGELVYVVEDGEIVLDLIDDDGYCQVCGDFIAEPDIAGDESGLIYANL